MKWGENGGDVESLMKILGHRNPKMLALYINLAITDLQSKNDKFNPLNHVSTQRVESLRNTLNSMTQKATIRPNEEGKPLPKTGFQPTFDSNKISRLWDEDDQ